jgi:hypothetical protein
MSISTQTSHYSWLISGSAIRRTVWRDGQFMGVTLPTGFGVHGTAIHERGGLGYQAT